MKKLILSFLFVFIAMSAFTQISQTPIKTFNEEVNPFVFTYTNGDQVLMSVGGNVVSIYNLSLSLLKTIDFSDIQGAEHIETFGIADGRAQWENAEMEVSEKIFNNDDLLEFMIKTTDGFAIVNENKVEVFRKTYTDGWWCDYSSLIETKNGNLLKVLLYKGNDYNTSMTEIYALPGYVTPLGARVMSVQKLGNPYPNPSNTYINLPYSLPEGVREAAIIIFDEQGRMIKTFRADRYSDYVRLNTTNLSAGNYFYFLDIRGQKGESKQFIVK
jgi:hypothetical protein